MSVLQRHTGRRASADVDEQLYRLDVMTQDDVAEVSRVERRCFPNPWPVSAYRRELQNPAQNAYVVLREVKRAVEVREHVLRNGHRRDSEAPRVKPVPRRSLLPLGLPRRQDATGNGRAPIIGFAGMWLAFDEAHLTTIGVDSTYRGRGFGELLLLCMIDEAIARGANWLTLEVRVSNVAAQTLYRKYGFMDRGTRKRYYSDNHEDALIMWSRPLAESSYRADIERRRRALAERLAGEIEPGPLTPIAEPVSQAAT